MSNLRRRHGTVPAYGKANSQYETEFEPGTGTIWGYFNPRGEPVLQPRPAEGHRRARRAARRRQGGAVEVDGQLYQVSYYVLASRSPRVFNVGGDLALFVMLIKAGDREAIANYAGCASTTCTGASPTSAARR